LLNVEEETKSETQPEITQTDPSQNIFSIDQATQALEATPDADQTEQPQPESQQQNIEPSPTHTLHSSETVNEPFVQQSQHEIVDNSQILTKQHLQNLTRNLEIDHGEQPINQSS
jgi:ABC-type uncharacterized transport system involved in gliding motility auxiliary subunit